MRVRMISGVKRITVLKAGQPAVTRRSKPSLDEETGSAERLKVWTVDGSRVTRDDIHLDLGARKKQTGILKVIDKKLRKLARREQKALGHYLALHEQSNRKRRNGWAKDIGRNLVRVIRRG
ncbi:hypothetical protein G3576_07805 [Roseomonas stagni]|uniref:Uncharacterized protein n=1 Tax=Falsiroseomonas algicola TaxID=2716930 RepID=A0A6M1LIB3_9PROT|nr:hypothetical protein [Falsiroseomonas algicola]NGM19917.1 hypothetical protein [Falsiroseomonas algicola]